VPLLGDGGGVVFVSSIAEVL